MPSIVWKGQLTFGLVSVPVKLYRAARRERVQMHYVHRRQPYTDQPEIANDYNSAPPEPPANSAQRGPQRLAALSAPEPALSAEPAPSEPPAPLTRVHQALVTPEDEPISRAGLLRGYELEPDRYVTFRPEELQGLRRKTSATMDIVRSVKLAEIDPVFFETSYYVAPNRGGEKPYAILFSALQATGHVALARVGMYGREHVVIVRPGRRGLLAHTMFYVDEIRSENEFHADIAAVGAKELDLAKTFLEALEGPFAPDEFKDEYRAELEALIAQKAAAAEPARATEPSAPPAPVVDIMEALRKSIAMARKPPAPETQPAKKPPVSVEGVKGKRPSRKAR